MRARRWIALVALGVGCQTPTSTTFEVSTDVGCEEERSVLAWLQSASSAVRPDEPTASATCRGPGGSSRAVGTIVALPSPDADEPPILLAQFVLAAVPGVTCTTEGPDCIVARRRLGFVDGAAVAVEVPLDASCSGVICDPEDTCAKGVCVSASLDAGLCDGGRCAEGDLGNDGTKPQGPATAAGTGGASSSSGEGGAAPASASSSSASASTSSGSAGGEGAGGQGGAGGEGGAAACGDDALRLLAVGQRSVCAVLGTDILCHGAGWAWEQPPIPTPDSCQIELAVIPQGAEDRYCARFHGAGCTQLGVGCWDTQASADGEDIGATLDAAPYSLNPTGGGTCWLDVAGMIACADPNFVSEVPRGAILRGLVSHGARVCGHAEDGPACPSLQGALEPGSGACLRTLALGPTYACGAFGGVAPRVDCAAFPSGGKEPMTGLPLDLDAVQVAVGAAHACALDQARDVTCFGDDARGQLGGPGPVVAIPPALGPFVSVAAGVDGTCALHARGEVWCWGGNDELKLCSEPPCAGSELLQPVLVYP